MRAKSLVLGVAATLAATAVSAAAAASSPPEESSADTSSDSTVTAASPTPPEAPPTPDEIGAIEIDRPLKVTSIGYANEITLLWAFEKGIFEDYGLEIERVTVGGGSAAVASVSTGAVDIGFTNGLSAIQAFQQGFNVRIVLGAYENAQPWDPETGRGVVIGPDSDVEEVCDLEGEKVGVQEFGNLGYHYWLAWLRANDCDPDEVNFVTVPAGQIADAVIEGRIAGAEMPAYDVHKVVEAGGTLLGEPMWETSGRVEYAMYIADGGFVEENPNTIAAFQAAMTQSLIEILDPANEDEQYEIAAEYANTTPEVLRSTQRELLDTTIDVDVLESIVQILIDNGALSEPLDLTELDAAP